MGLDVFVQGAQGVAVFVDGEAGDDPDDFAQEVDDGADVAEFGAEFFVAQVEEVESGRGGSGAGVVGVAGVAGVVGLRAEEVFAEFGDAVRADVLGEVGAAGFEDAGDLGPVDGDRVAAGDEVEGFVGEGQRRFVRVVDDDDAAGA